jgi:hypothetical protein
MFLCEVGNLNIENVLYNEVLDREQKGFLLSERVLKEQSLFMPYISAKTIIFTSPEFLDRNE